MASVLQAEPDIRVDAVRWAQTSDGVLIEWVNRGTVNGTSLEIPGVDRYVLRDGKGVVGRAYFDPRPFIEAVAAGER